jgi:hypothetical protein
MKGLRQTIHSVNVKLQEKPVEVNSLDASVRTGKAFLAAVESFLEISRQYNAAARNLFQKAHDLYPESGPLEATLSSLGSNVAGSPFTEAATTLKAELLRSQVQGPVEGLGGICRDLSVLITERNTRQQEGQ